MFTHLDFLAGRTTTSDLADLVDDAVRSCDTQLVNFGGHHRFTGTIQTLSCRDDNSLLKDVLSTPGDGRVLVVDGGGTTHSALIGDVIAGIGARHGWAGVVIHGAVRDSRLLARVPIGVKGIGTNPRRSGKRGEGEVGAPLSFGGVTFTPGETVYSDEDGVVVIDVPPVGRAVH